MKWIKHDTNANQDAKLKRMRMKYGLEGYGLYWYCLELIAADVDRYDRRLLTKTLGFIFSRNGCCIA
ncbi:MAG: Lin1244/Lin1753 domain-containing protein, partial [Oleispira sp.]